MADFDVAINPSNNEFSLSHSDEGKKIFDGPMYVKYINVNGIDVDGVGQVKFVDLNKGQTLFDVDEDGQYIIEDTWLFGCKLDTCDADVAVAFNLS